MTKSWKNLWRYFDAQCPIMNLHSPRGNVRGKAHHKCADEGADLLGGPQPPTLLLIQTFLPHTDKAHRYHYLPRGGSARDMPPYSIQESHHKSVSPVLSFCQDYSMEIAQDTDINYANGSNSKFNYLTKWGGEANDRASNHEREASVTFMRHRDVNTECQQALVIIIHIALLIHMWSC